MKKQIAILFLAVLLAVGMAWNSYQQALQSAYSDEYEAAARRLRVERSEVEKELDSVRKQLRQVVIGKGAGAFVFEELPEAVYEDAYPVLKKFGYPAVLAFSPKNLPEQEGNLTIKQVKRLMKEGWSTCLLWDDMTELGRYTENMKNNLEELGLELPTTLYVVQGDYQTFKDEDIFAQGYTTVIHHGEALEVIAREDEEELFHVGAVRWDRQGIRSIVSRVAEHGGSIVFSIDFSTQAGSFEPELFGNMCKVIQDNQKLYVTDPDGLRQNLSMTETNDYLTQREAYLVEELERYDKEIAAVYQVSVKSVE